MFIRRQEARRRLLYEKAVWSKALFAELQKWLFNYGESLRRIAGISALTIVLSWIVYMIGGVVANEEGTILGPGIQAIAAEPSLVIQALVHSVRVFFVGNTALEPVGLLGSVVIAGESMIGPILVALVIFVLGRRAAR